MRVRPELTPERVNRELLRFVLRRPPVWFWVVVVGLGGLVGAAAAVELLLAVSGLHLLGLTNTVYWAVLITNFVFWVGISHAGVMISAILRLTHAEWRRPITRAAEVLALFALATATIFPLIHTGRVWRTLTWVFPYDFTREIWPNVRSTLIWDPSAIVTYLVGTLLFVYVDLIPDAAVARDRTEGWRRALYALLALGFRGTTRQWRMQRVAGQVMAALILPVFVSVHSIVAWDFSMAILPGWHATVLAPYFVVGAVHSGVAGVVTVMALLRLTLRLDDYVTREHFDVIGRLQIAVALGYLFFFLMDFYFGVFGRAPVELRIWELRLLTPPTSWLFYLQVLTALVIPFPLWLFRRCRRSVWVMLFASLSVNVGMYLERYILVITPLQFKQPFVFLWVDTYRPTLAESVLTVGSVALVGLGLLLFAKLLPIVPIWDVKEGQVVRRELLVGRARLPAALRE